MSEHVCWIWVKLLMDEALRWIWPEGKSHAELQRLIWSVGLGSEDAFSLRKDGVCLNMGVWLACAWASGLVERGPRQ